MPLPRPRDDEEPEAFLARCTADPTVRAEFPSPAQRAAACARQWDEHGEDEDDEADRKEKTTMNGARRPVYLGLARERFTLERFRAKAATDSVPPNALVHLPAPTAIESVGERVLKFTISTGAVDRDRDTLNPKGWLLDNFRRSGAVLWAHDYTQPPIAKSLSVNVSGGALVAVAEFPTADLYAFGNQIFKLLVARYLSATSVGFSPKEYEYNAARGGVDYQKQELLEWSVVPVPSNPEALMEARSKGIDAARYKSWWSESPGPRSADTFTVSTSRSETSARPLSPTEIAAGLGAKLDQAALRKVGEALLSKSIGPDGCWVPRTFAEAALRESADVRRRRLAASRTVAPRREREPERVTIAHGVGDAVRREVGLVHVYDAGRAMSTSEVASLIRSAIEQKAESAMREAESEMRMKLFGLVD